MIRATQLSGRAVVDMDVAEKLGRVERIIIDPDARRVAGIQVSRRESLLGGATRTTLPATAVYAIGPDAITVRHAIDSGDDAERFDRLPRVSDLVGRKVISRDGRLLGLVADVLISGPDGRIVGYELTHPDVLGRLSALFGEGTPRPWPYLRADADLRTGRELIVAPDDAVSDWDEERAATPAEAARGPAQTPPARTVDQKRETNWFRGDHPRSGVEPPRPGE